MRILAGLCLTLGGLSACAAFPGAREAGPRLLADGWVVVTAPVQVPAMAARDAWGIVRHPALKVAVFPVAMAGQTVWHTGLTALHVLDLIAAPVHLFLPGEPPRIYEPYRLPMKRVPEADLATDAGRILLRSAGSVGGIGMAYVFGVWYVPRALAL